jgi:HEAT repeat protein
MQQAAALLLGALLFQTPSIESTSPKEREAAIEQMAVLGNAKAIPALAAALKKEPKSDLRAAIVAGLSRIHDKAAIPPITEALAGDLDKDVRLQAIDALLRLYIQIDGSEGPIRTIFNKVRSVFFYPERPMVGPEVKVDLEATAALASSMQKDFVDAVRVEAARALGSLMAKEQMPALIATLEEPRNRASRRPCATGTATSLPNPQSRSASSHSNRRGRPWSPCSEPPRTVPCGAALWRAWR